MYKQKNGWKIEKSESHVGEGFVLSTPEEDDHQDVRDVVQCWHQNVPDQERNGGNGVCSLDILTERLSLARRELPNIRLDISRQAEPSLQTFLLTADIHLVLSCPVSPSVPAPSHIMGACTEG